jgi:hypothetical protein
MRSSVEDNPISEFDKLCAELNAIKAATAVDCCSPTWADHDDMGGTSFRLFNRVPRVAIDRLAEEVELVLRMQNFAYRFRDVLPDDRRITLAMARQVSRRRLVVAGRSCHGSRRGFENFA